VPLHSKGLRNVTDIHSSFFYERVVGVYNELSSNEVDFSSFTAFKRTVHNVDLSGFILFHAALIANVLLTLIRFFFML